jgi:hypothetical protein
VNRVIDYLSHQEAKNLKLPSSLLSSFDDPTPVDATVTGAVRRRDDRACDFSRRSSREHLAGSYGVEGVSTASFWTILSDLDSSRPALRGMTEEGESPGSRASDHLRGCFTTVLCAIQRTWLPE